MDNPHSILIVEDDLIVTGFLLSTLADRYDCKTAADVGDGLLLLQSHPFDLIIADVGLPDCSGLAVNLYVQKTRPGTPVVMISGKNDPAIAEQARENGAFEFLKKPFTPDQLKAVVERALSGGAGQAPYGRRLN